MKAVWFEVLSSVFAVSLISLVGIFFIGLNKDFLEKIISFLVSFAVGALLGDVFLHIFPEMAEEGFTLFSGLFVLFGITLFFLLEKAIHWRHCHQQTTKEHPHPVAWMNLVGDAFHNFFDGMMIAGAYLASIPLGIATTLAVVFHEIPQEIGDFGILVYAGFSRTKALLANFLSALAAVLGAVAVLLFSASFEGTASAILPLTAGGFIYIASSDLIPELKKEAGLSKNFQQLFGILLGIAVMLALKILFE